MAVDSGTYDEATLARRAKIAEALFQGQKRPVQHWTQGLADVANTAVGAYGLNKVDEESKAADLAQNAALLKFLGGGASPDAAAPTVPGGGVAAALSTPAPNTAPGKIYSENEPSPLDPPMGQDRDAAVRTVLAEAGNQGPTGMNAVASVMRNRAVNGGFGGDTVGGVAKAPNQFEPWNTAGGRAKMAAIDPNGPQYQAAGQALDSAYAGNDPTNGATHFFAPKAQAALGRNAPSWGRQGGQDIGDHRFFGSPAQPEATPAPYQVAGPAVAPPANPVAAALGSPGGAPANGGDTKAKIAQLLSSTNPQERKLGRSLAQGIIETEAKRNPLDDEAKRLEIQSKKKGLEAAPTVQRIKQPDGSEVAVQWDNKSGSWVPLKAPEGGNPVANPKLTEQQSKDVGFFNRGQRLLPRLERQDQALTDIFSAGGGQISNYLKTDAYRQAEQTGQELLAVILRKDTGAAVTPDEMTRYGAIYLPKPGDDAATIQQKRIARQTAMEGLRMGLGSADIIFKSREAAEAAKGDGAPGASAAPASAPKAPPKVGEIQEGHIFKGGNPADPKNWEPVS